MKFLLAIVLAFFTQIALAQEFGGYLGQGDAFEIYEPEGQASFPKYWEWERFKLDHNRVYTCRVWTRINTFLPEIWIENVDGRGHVQGVPRGVDQQPTSSGKFMVSVVKFRPRYNTHFTRIGVTSKNDSRWGDSPQGYYKVECTSKPWKYVPPLPRKPIPPPMPVPPTPPSPGPIDPCESPSWIVNKTKWPKADFILAKRNYGGGAGYTWEGGKLWGHGGDQYLIQTAGGFIKYDNCGVELEGFKREYNTTLADGRSREGGYSHRMDDTTKRTGEWYGTWN